MGGRRWAVSGADDDYDLGNIRERDYDVESRSASMDSDHQGSETSWSKESYVADEPMLRKTSGRRRITNYYRYRIPARIVRYMCFALMSAIVLFILFLVRQGMMSDRHLAAMAKDRPRPPAPWESFEFLKRFYGGLRTLVPRDQNIAEYPVDMDVTSTPSKVAREPPLEPDSLQNTTRPVPSSTPYIPYPDYSSSEYTVEYGPVQECFLDAEDKIRPPQIHAYPGIPQGFPDAIIGSYEVTGLDDTMCFDRYGKFGPYGFGYSLKKGGIGAGVEGEREGSENVWKYTGQVDYSDVNWGEAQERCVSKNQHRFSAQPDAGEDAFHKMRVGRSGIPHARDDPHTSVLLTNQTTKTTPPTALKPISRTAILIRTYTGHELAPEDILFVRSLVSELSILSGGEYSVHFLIHVKDDNQPIWSDPATYNQTLQDALPAEFVSMGTLWSERQMGLIYGGLEESFYRDLPVHGVYRSSFMPVQYFAQKHPEYDFFWNWEMDIRYTGHWYKLFESIREWARDQPRKGLWERSGRFYLPQIHGSWEDFKQMVRVQSEMTPEQQNRNKVVPGHKPNIPKAFQDAPPKIEKPIWGAVAPDDTLAYDTDPTPPTSYEKDKYSWGVGEEADLITLLPLFDPDGTDWILAKDVTGYNKTAGLPPRRTAILTASRLSARLLSTMHRETALQRHSMFAEMWPASCALHHGFKAVYAPHPMFIDRNWPPTYLASVLNAGSNGATGGSRKTVFGDPMQHNLRGVTWYYNSGFAGNLYRRWLGYRVDGGGGEEEEMVGEGRMCLPPMLIHPVKEVQLVVEEVMEEEDG